MTTGLIEQGRLFSLVNMQVDEARSNERMTGSIEGLGALGRFTANLEWGFNRLVKSLVGQAPNRVFYSPDGKIGRVLLFKGIEQPYGAYFQAFEQVDDRFRVLEWADFECSKLEQLEGHILRLRDRFQMAGDLIERPVSVFGIRRTEEFIHLSSVSLIAGASEEQPSFYYHYRFNHIGHRAVSMGRITEGFLQEVDALARNQMASVPQEVLDYAHPFPG